MAKLSGSIRKITYGVIPSTMNLPMPRFEMSVGQKFGDMQVIDIVREPIRDGKSEYHIECMKMDPKGVCFGNSFIWKTFCKEPDVIEFFAPDEKHNYVIL